MRIKNQSGLALIITLIFLQIIAILGLFAIESNIEMGKMSRLLWQQNNNFSMAEQQLHFIEMQLIKTLTHCLIPTTPANELLNKSLSWWHSVACTGAIQDFEYYYLIEKLNLDQCAEVDSLEKISNLNSTPQYLRISLLMFNKKNESKEFLQSTILTLDNTIHLICDGVHHKVDLGRQMWRELR
ncbi:MAG: pilus assembly PilX N-terminal domain-containing protein [Gammaproteobacteria bacterium]|nr:pilus assembly PilX N-terminal domain-containing protein [Gammaproteobacteria bacterium]